MHIRSGNPGDANAIASLIASFQAILTLEPSGAGAEQYLASVSEDAERRYLESPRYAYLIAELEGQMVGLVAMRDQKHLFHLFVAAAYQRIGIAGALWERARKLSLRAGPIAEFTVNSSLNAVPVYRSFGFLPVGAVMQEHGSPSCQCALRWKMTPNPFVPPEMLRLASGRHRAAREHSAETVPRAFDARYSKNRLDLSDYLRRDPSLWLWRLCHDRGNHTSESRYGRPSRYFLLAPLTNRLTHKIPDTADRRRAGPGRLHHHRKLPAFVAPKV